MIGQILCMVVLGMAAGEMTSVGRTCSSCHDKDCDVIEYEKHSFPIVELFFVGLAVAGLAFFLFGGGNGGSHGEYGPPPPYMKYGAPAPMEYGPPKYGPIPPDTKYGPPPPDMKYGPPAPMEYGPPKYGSIPPDTKYGPLHPDMTMNPGPQPPTMPQYLPAPTTSYGMKKRGHGYGDTLPSNENPWKPR